MVDESLQKVNESFSRKLEHLVDVKYKGKKSLFYKAYDEMFPSYNADGNIKSIEKTAKNWFRYDKGLPNQDKLNNLLILFDCDYEYLCGGQETPRRCDLEITERLGLSEQAIETLKGYPEEYKGLLDNLITAAAPTGTNCDTLFKYLLQTMSQYGIAEWDRYYRRNLLSLGDTYRELAPSDNDSIKDYLTIESYKKVLQEIRKLYEPVNDVFTHDAVSDALMDGLQQSNIELRKKRNESMGKMEEMNHEES